MFFSMLNAEDTLTIHKQPACRSARIHVYIILRSNKAGS